MKAVGRSCELCGGAAAVHCGADTAYLCWGCDARVHGANFLVARHVRQVVCCDCGGPAGRRLSGPGSSAPIRALCHSCRPDAGDPATSSTSSSSSSSCISSAESSPAQECKPFSSSSSSCRSRRCVSAEAVLEGWGRRMGLRGERRCVETACHVLGAFGREVAVAPLRVTLAAALWHGVKACGEDGGDAEESNRGRRRVGRTSEETLRRLEACSGVPARLIVVVESRIARAARRTRLYEEEGWAECS